MSSKSSHSPAIRGSFRLARHVEAATLYSATQLSNSSLARLVLVTLCESIRPAVSPEGHQQKKTANFAEALSSESVLNQNDVLLGYTPKVLHLSPAENAATTLSGHK